MQLSGTIKKSTLEGGNQWLLDADDGTTYQLEGLSYNFEPGETLYFEGEVDDTTCTIGMQGPVFKFGAYSDMAPEPANQE